MPESPSAVHRKEAEKLPPARVGVLTISDTRTPETDESGAIIKAKLAAAGHVTGEYLILRDEPAEIREVLSAWSESDDLDAILTNGGTGISSRDGTYEAVSSLLDRTLPGFGEIFRMLSWQEIGAASMLSRAIAGVYDQTVVFCMPGSANAVTLAMDQLIIPELAHIIYELKKERR